MEKKPGYSQKTISGIALIGAQLSFSGWHVIGSICLKDGNTDAFVFAFWREILSTILMVFLFHYIHHDQNFNLKTSLSIIYNVLFGQDCKSFIFLGFCSFLNVMGATLALSMTDASIFAILQPLIPCVATSISIMTGFEGYTHVKCIGICMAVIGAVVVEVWGGTSSSTSSTSSLIGLIIIIIQVTACGTYLVYQKPILAKYHSTLVTLLYYTVGTAFTSITIFCYSLWTNLSSSSMILDAAVFPWLGITYVVVFSTLFAWNAFSYAGKYLSPSLCTVFMSLQPVFTAIMMYLVYNQVLTTPQYFGAVLVIGGMVVTVKGSDQENEEIDVNTNSVVGGTSNANSVKYRLVNQEEA